MLIPLLICLGVLGLVFAIVALPGATIARRRKAAILRALPDTLPDVAVRTYARHRSAEDAPPLDAVEHDWYDALHRYAAVVDAYAAPRLEAIDTALAAFMVKHQIELPDIKPVGPADCSPWAAVDLALVRLRVGIREPIWYERTCTADTGMWDTGELHALLDASEACEASA